MVERGGREGKLIIENTGLQIITFGYIGYQISTLQHDNYLHCTLIVN
jgi:hypothetical protein